MKQNYTISILADNEAGVLARIVALFSSCCYNIDTLNVAPVNFEKSLSKITLTTISDEKQIQQIQKQIEKVVPVQSVKAINIHQAACTELALVKIAADHKEIFKNVNGIQMLKEDEKSCIFEVTASSSFLDNLFQKVPVLDIARTGVLALE